MAFVKAIVGALSLLLGRQLFWLFVGAAGFLLGYNLALRFLGSEAGLFVTLVAIFVGLLGAGLALFAQRLALGLAGFIAGGYFFLYLVNLVGFGGADGLSTFFTFAIFLVGAIIGAVLVQLLFDFALILLSSAVGATLLTQAVGAFWSLSPTPNTLLFVVLLLVGFGVQWGTWQQMEGRATREAE